MSRLTCERGRTWPAWPRLCWRCDRHKRTLHGSAAETENRKSQRLVSQLRVLLRGSQESFHFTRLHFYTLAADNFHHKFTASFSLWIMPLLLADCTDNMPPQPSVPGCAFSLLWNFIFSFSDMYDFTSLAFQQQKSLKSWSSKPGSHIKEWACSLRV